MRYNFFVCLLFLSICSCTQQRQVQTIDLSPRKTAEVTLIEEKTTKQELIQALGSPTDADTDSMTWSKSADPREYFVVHYIQKDGTAFDVCVGQNINYKNGLHVYYTGIWTGTGDSENPPLDHNPNRNIVTSVHFY